MRILSPSILSADFKNLGQQIVDVKEAGAEYLHVDVMDGVFVKSISLGMPVIKSARSACDIFFDVHLMIVDPVRYIEEIAASGADGITFHLEAAEDPMAVIDKIHSLGKRAGISIKPGTDVSALEPFIDKVEMILLMTVEPGFGGQKIIPESFDRIKAVRKMLETTGSKADLEVDGGIKKDNVQSIVQAGANVIVAGSAIYAGDAAANVKEFLSLINNA
ncbi:ribulose-phosphate 3-epimerase [Oribacterium sp. KHPX15]|uniref:ribulose-phosphate 3-epimerase n=1 Tax=Oribacterium sp. KHPX15 TaxID=1855342 RepID=UPI00089BE1AF|nr:ribulose-phosphate 3-epimerase [Oribacterium sp. KHPX15]SEA54522.1 ribulose-phosphate 3-epimerase [Oribacterium sp. KHPX15]